MNGSGFGSPQGTIVSVCHRDSADHYQAATYLPRLVLN